MLDPNFVAFATSKPSRRVRSSRRSRRQRDELPARLPGWQAGLPGWQPEFRKLRSRKSSSTASISRAKRCRRLRFSELIVHNAKISQPGCQAGNPPCRPGRPSFELRLLDDFVCLNSSLSTRRRLAAAASSMQLDFPNATLSTQSISQPQLPGREDLPARLPGWQVGPAGLSGCHLNFALSRDSLTKILEFSQRFAS